MLSSEESCVSFLNASITSFRSLRYDISVRIRIRPDPAAACFEKARQQTTADVSSRAGQQDASRRREVHARILFRGMMCVGTACCGSALDVRHDRRIASSAAALS